MRMTMEDDIINDNFTLYGCNDVLSLLNKTGYANIWVCMPNTHKHTVIKTDGRKTPGWYQVTKVLKTFAAEEMALSKLNRIYLSSEKNELGLVF